MEALIENLLKEIKEDTRYINFMEAEKNLQDKDVLTLLKNYHQTYETYQDVKQYEPYISSEQEKQAWIEAKKKLSHHPMIQQYYQSYYELNELLDEVTNIVFKDISDDIILSK